MSKGKRSKHVVNKGSKTSSAVSNLQLFPVQLSEQSFEVRNHRNHEEGEYCPYGIEIVSKEIEVKNAGEKGLGVFAKRQLRKGTSIPYIAKKVKQFGLVNKQYLVACDRTYVFDGNPNSDYIKNHAVYINDKKKKLVKLTCIGNYVNHAKKENANSILFNVETSSEKSIGPYPITYRYLPNYLNIPLWVVVTRLVKKGEEICFDYAWDNFTKNTYNIKE